MRDQDVNKPYIGWVIPVLIQKSTTLMVIIAAISGAIDLGKVVGSPGSADELTWRERIPFLDGKYYLRLARYGYSPGDEACAFYPLWPLLIRVVSPIFAGDLLITALFLANGLSIAAFFLFYRLVSRQFGEPIAHKALILLLAAPGAIFFTLLYSEALFLLLALLFFHGLLTGRTWLVCATGFMLPMARAVGIFALLPITYQLIEAGWRRWSRGHFARKQPDESVIGNVSLPRQMPSATDGPVIAFPGRRLWMGVVCIVAGFLCYLLIMYTQTGNAFEGFDAQGQFPATPSVLDIFRIPQFFRSFFNVASVHSALHSAVDRLFFLLFLATLPQLWRLDRRYFFYALGVGLVPAMSTSFMSYTRFVEMCFPMFIVIAQWMSNPRRTWLMWYYVTVSGITQGAFLIRSMNHHWAG
jgi:hypothetical protein